MLRSAALLLIVALVGFTDIASAPAGVAQMLFELFLLFLATVRFGVGAGATGVRIAS